MPHYEYGMSVKLEEAEADLQWLSHFQAGVHDFLSSHSVEAQQTDCEQCCGARLLGLAGSSLGHQERQCRVKACSRDAYSFHHALVSNAQSPENSTPRAQVRQSVPIKQTPVMPNLISMHEHKHEAEQRRAEQRKLEWSMP